MIPIKVSLKHLPQQYFLPKIGTFATLFGSFLQLLPQNRLLLDNIENTKKETLFYKSSRKASGDRTDKLQTILPQKKRPISQQTPKQKIVKDHWTRFNTKINFTRKIRAFLVKENSWKHVMRGLFKRLRISTLKWIK